MKSFEDYRNLDRVSLEEGRRASTESSPGYETETLLLGKDSCQVEVRQLELGEDTHRPVSRCPFTRFISRRTRWQAHSGCEDCQTPCRRRNGKLRMFAKVVVATLSLLGACSLVQIVLGFGPLIYPQAPPPEEQWWPHWGEPGEPGDGLAHYPTDFTRDVIPIPCHSHNDYWRRIPLFEGIHYGCTGTEADVWLFKEELFVGHTPAALTANRTFRSLYVDPLVRILDNMNQDTPFSQHTRNGVFDEEAERTLVLLVDFKNSGEAIFPYVLDQIDPLRQKNYLTYFNGTDLIPGPITVVGTGNTPFNLINAPTPRREIFFDAPLDAIRAASASSQTTGQGTTGIDKSLGALQFNASNSYYASTDFMRSIGFPWRGSLSESQLLKLRLQIRAAHDQGLKARYWNTPPWPVWLRNRVWKTLVDEGADYLNVDDLRAAATEDWTGRAGSVV